MSPLHSISAIGCFLHLQLEPLIKADNEDGLFTSIISLVITPLVIWYLNTLVYDFLGLRRLPKFWSGLAGLTCPNNRIYMDTAVVVLITYVSLLVINLTYISLVVFPAIALAFIGALRVELQCQSRSQGDDNGDANPGCTSTGTDKDEKAVKKSEELKATSRISAVPNLVLCVMGHFHHAADKYAVSPFLLFLSSTLGALTLMMVKLPSGIAPGVAPASELLRKASLVVLLVTVHTVAAESLGKDVILSCTPEFVPVLLWFSVHLDRGSSIISVDKIKSCKSWLVVLSAVVAAVFAYLGVSMGESGLSRCTRALVSCGISGLLIYYVVFMLRQWPGQAGMATPSLEEAIQLLRFWANALLIAAAALTVFTSLAAARLGLHDPTVAALAKLFDEYSV